MASKKYKELLRTLSDRLVLAQREIRILDSIKWGKEVEEGFRQAKGCELPKVDQAYYPPLPFDPKEKKHELRTLERDTRKQLGQLSPAGGVLARMCEEFIQVVEMLDARGTPEFSLICQELYGSATEAFHAGDPTLADLGRRLSSTLDQIAAKGTMPEEVRDISGAQAVEVLQARLTESFPKDVEPPEVRLADGIVADAAAGADYIKLRAEARFSDRELRMLEIHEGWVHLGTNRNGKAQPYCTFLSKGTPSATVTQEGLAIFMELLTFTSHPTRVRKISNRIEAVRRAEQGADFLDVYRFFQEQAYNDDESYALTVRVFRGSTPDGAPFTKDLSYGKGFVLVYNWIQLAVERGLLDRIPLLFCGKTSLGDLRVIAELVDEGLVSPPRFVPPPIKDIHGLVAWMCYSSFLGSLDWKRLRTDYSQLL